MSMGKDTQTSSNKDQFDEEKNESCWLAQLRHSKPVAAPAFDGL